MRLFEFDENNPKIFTTTTGLPDYDDMLKNPEYFAKEKGKVFIVVDMSPDEYLAHCRNGFGDENFTPEAHLVDEYTKRVQAGSKMPMAVLKYELVEDDRRGNYTSFSQEGRHRAYVAKRLDVNVMPVMVVASSYPAHKFRDQFEEFKTKIFSKF